MHRHTRMIIWGGRNTAPCIIQCMWPRQFTLLICWLENEAAQTKNRDLMYDDPLTLDLKEQKWIFVNSLSIWRELSLPSVKMHLEWEYLTLTGTSTTQSLHLKIGEHHKKGQKNFKCQRTRKSAMWLCLLELIGKLYPW